METEHIMMKTGYKEEEIIVNLAAPAADLAGQIAALKEASLNAFGELAEEVNRAGDRQSYRYDDEGRLTGRTAWSGNVTAKEYRDGGGSELVRYHDGTTALVTRDMAGNVIRAEGETGVIRYRYDAAGKLAEQYDEASGERTAYRYDRAGNRERMVNGNRDVRYVYGKNNELLRVRDVSQRLEVTYQYDARGREILRTYGNGVKQ